jgi:AcrR family transcriptional regulator
MTDSGRSSPPTPPHYLQIAWALQDPDPEDAGTGLSARKVVQAGIALADQEGLAGLSIRKLQRQLGFTTMALYRHVRSRGELLLVMADAALGPPPVAIAAEPDWRDGLRAWGRGLFARYQTHPWLLDMPAFSVPTTPNHIRWVEAYLACVATSPLGLQPKLDAALLIDGHARHIADLRRHAHAQAAGPPASPAWLRALITRAEHPFFAAVLEAGVLADAVGPEFDFGLDCVIAGLATRSPS